MKEEKSTAQTLQEILEELRLQTPDISIGQVKERKLREQDKARD